ncbi:MAG: tetratricopeptide repeat protein [Alphaproteobacteria bacterium]|nr:tetratricopeptide repeat protein [Alphaproteobacteria bacterium]
MSLTRLAALALITATLPGCADFPLERSNWLDWLRPASTRAVSADNGPLDEGRRYLEAGHAGLAIDPLRRAALLEGRTSRVLNALGAAYAEVGRNDLSVRYFQEALAKNPDDPATLNNIGYAALRQGHLDLARRYLERAARFAPQIEETADDGMIIENNMIRLLAAEVRTPDSVEPKIRKATGPRALSLVYRRSERVIALATRPDNLAPANGNTALSLSRGD